MKLILTIFCLVVTCAASAQSIEWVENDIRSNKVARALRYTEVPDTNPEYFTEPRGLILKSETDFDTLGRPVKIFRPNGLALSHGPSMDVIEEFFYQGDKLIRKHHTAYDTVVIDYVYDDVRRIRAELTKDPRGRRKQIAVQYFDGLSREVNAVEIYFSDDSGVHVMVEKWEYGKRESVKQWTKAEFFVITPGEQQLLHSVADIKSIIELSETIAAYEKIREKPFLKPAVYTYDKNGRVVQLATRGYKNRRDYNIYEYDNKGLLNKVTVHFGVYDAVDRIRYVYR